MRLRLVLFLLGVLTACGGGSAGTGTGDEYRIQGEVVTTTGVPIEGATVTVVDTGDTDVTDAKGAFAIDFETDLPAVTLMVETVETSATTTISVASVDGTISLSIKINPFLDTIEVDQFQMNSKIVGTCDIYFENRRVIRQANPVPKGLTCVARVTTKAGSLPLAHVPVAIQFRSCNAKAPWNTVALGATMTGANLGVAQIEFPYFDDRAHCLYRIIAPFEDDRIPPVEKEIWTATYQGS
jgi:hypothetical protein